MKLRLLESTVEDTKAELVHQVSLLEIAMERLARCCESQDLSESRQQALIKDELIGLIHYEECLSCVILAKLRLCGHDDVAEAYSTALEK